MEDQRTESEKAYDERYEELVKSGIDLKNKTFKSEEELIEFCEENDLMTA